MEIEKWKDNTKRLTLGIGFAVPLMLMYNVLIFMPEGGWRHGAEAKSGDMLLTVGFIALVLSLSYICVVNYTRGLSRFAANFEEGGKRSLWMIRWGFILTAAGIALQLFVFRFFNMRVAGFGQLILGNIVLIAAAALGIVGFASLATIKGLADEGRKGAINMTWTTLVLLTGACLESYVIQRHNVPLAWFWKALALAANIVGAFAFFLQWKHILAAPSEAQQATGAKAPVATAGEQRTNDDTHTMETGSTQP
ncbi:MAG: hypothetical protein SPJ13_06415 [Bacteroidales bacterium]|nr:hypothetical protein [Bacteroidales bacterium]